MKWFKHYDDASASVKVSQIVDEFGLEGYARWFLLLELLSSKYDGETTIFEIHFSELSAKLRIKFTKKLDTFMELLHNFCLIQLEIHSKVYKIECPILADLKDRDFKRARAVRAKNPPKIKIKDKDLDKDKDIYIDQKNMLTFWNSLDIIKHGATQPLLKKIHSKMNSLKKDGFAVQDIELAINRYANIINGTEYFFNYKWPLVDFLGRDNARKFYGENFVVENFKRHGNNKSTAQERQDAMVNMENPYAKR